MEKGTGKPLLNLEGHSPAEKRVGWRRVKMYLERDRLLFKLLKKTR